MCFLPAQTSDVTRGDEPAARNPPGVRGAAPRSVRALSVCHRSSAPPVSALLLLVLPRCRGCVISPRKHRRVPAYGKSQRRCTQMSSSQTLLGHPFLQVCKGEGSQGLLLPLEARDVLSCDNSWRENPMTRSSSSLPAVREARPAPAVISVCAVAAPGTLTLL